MAKAKVAKGTSLENSVASPVRSEQDMKYETDNHLRTLSDAFDIMGDPEKMKRVHKLAGRRHKAITSIKELRDRANDAFKPDKGDAEDDKLG